MRVFRVEFPAVPRDRPLQVRCLHFPAFWGSKRGYWQQSAEFKPLSPLDKAFHADMDRAQVTALRGTPGSSQIPILLCRYGLPGSGILRW